VDLGGKYRIVERIAAGGMGEVYRGAMTTIGGVDKAVALKVVRSEHAEDPEFAELFVEEAKLAMKLSHANVVHSFDVGKIDDRWFIAMEHVRGVDAARLLHACKQNGELVPERFALFIAVEALKGVDYAHRLRSDDGEALAIVHRDISPANILVSYEGEVKVADFGIAKSTLRAARSNTVKGKIPYMAPEQLRGASVDRRADLYSIGATLYELLSGERIVPDDRLSFDRVLEGRIRPLGEVATADERLVRIVMKALSTDPEDRYATAAQMRQELEAYAMSEGYLLSSADLAEFVADRFEGDRPADVATVTTAPASDRREPVVAELGFDMLLGRELMEVASTGGFRVFTSRVSAPPPAPAPAVHAPPLATAPRRLPIGWLVGLGVAAIALAGVALALGGGPEEGTPARASSGARVDRAVAEPTRASSTMEIAARLEPESPTAALPARNEGAMPATEARAETERVDRTPRMVEPAVAQARLSANTDPWSYVYLDGALLGPTPIVNRSVPAGPHRIRFVTADDLERTVEVEVEEGQHRRVSLDLR
jgi:hypothetical protein